MATKFKHSSDSANIAYYKGDDGEHWGDVLRSWPVKRGEDGVITRDRSKPISYYFTLYKYGEGEVGKAKVERPRSRAPEHLPERTVNKTFRDLMRCEHGIFLVGVCAACWEETNGRGVPERDEVEA